MSHLYIYGCGGIGRELAELAMEMQRWENISFVDDVTHTRKIHDLSVITLDKALHSSKGKVAEFVIAVGEPKSREFIFHKLKENDCSMITLHAPTATVSKKTHLSEGVVVHRGATITCDGYIAEGSFINKHVVIGHDVNVGKFSVISPNVTISGNVKIGSNTYVGSGALIREGISVGNNVIIGMGSVVLEDVPDFFVVVGNPARKIRENTTGTVFQK